MRVNRFRSAQPSFDTKRLVLTCMAGMAGMTLMAPLVTSPAHAQSTLNNPLMRPNTPSREPVLPAPPPGSPASPQSAGRGDGPVQAKSLQEEVTANQQRLNSDRVPQPLRTLLATVYVSAIHNKTAVLRQPLPPAQQAILAGQGSGLPGTAGAPGGIPGSFPGAGAVPGMSAGGVPGLAAGAAPGALPGGTAGAPLSAGTGLFNPFAVPPPRPTSIRVRDGEPFSLQGFDLTARIREQEVTLLWKNSEDKTTIVFQSGIESPSLPAYVPPQTTLERPDNAYFGRVQATTGAPSAAGGGGGGGGAGGTATGGGAR